MTILLGILLTGWNNLEAAEHISLATAIFTGLAFLCTAAYVRYTYKIMKSNEESVRILAEKEKPFLNIVTVEYTKEQRILDSINYNLWEITITNGGLVTATIQKVLVHAKTFRPSDKAEPVGVKAVAFADQMFVAPTHERSFLWGAESELTGDVTNPAPSLTMEMNIAIFYEGIGSDTYEYRYKGEYYKKTGRFIGKQESHRQITK